MLCAEDITASLRIVSPSGLREVIRSPIQLNIIFFYHFNGARIMKRALCLLPGRSGGPCSSMG